MRRPVLDELLSEARRSPDVECCGLLAGRDAVITHLYPARNSLASPSAYAIAPEDLFRIFREMRAAHCAHLGIYHSHPSGPIEPSADDIARAYYPDAAYFILSPSPHARTPVRAFRIVDGTAEELAIGIL